MYQRLTFMTIFGLLMTTSVFAEMPAALTEQVAKLTVDDVGEVDFGNTVALSGTTALVGAFRDNDGGGSQSGSAYIFERDEGGIDNWGQVAKLTADDAGAGDWFGYAVALSGTTALVGALRGGSIDSGSAYIFERDEGGTENWGQVAKLTANDAAVGDWFGQALALSDTTALVGARYDDDDGSRSGSAYVFERDEGGAGNWGQVAKLTADEPMADDEFGRSVAVSGTTALVGARYDDGNLLGSVYVFERDEGGGENWGQVTKLTADDVTVDNPLGRVALNGTTALVSASADDTGGVDSGAAYVFERDEGGAGNWGQVTKLTADDAAADDRFGSSVALSGATALVGAFRDDDDGNWSGSAYVFARHEGSAENWGQVAKLTAEDAAAGDWLGYSAALSGTTALVGAIGESDGDGAAYVFRIGIGPRLQIPTAIAATAASVDVPVSLTNNGATLAATAFSIDYDETCLDFDSTDADADGIPDAVTFHTPADFAVTVFFDLSDTDGEIDLSISSALPLTALADGDLVTITFTPNPSCIPTPPATILAPVTFSTDPSASFGDLEAQSVTGTTEDGSVEIFGGTRGDCNGDGLVDAADLSACTLELFDGDGDFWLGVPGGTFAGLPVGCDANADTLVDAGDLTCKNRLIFGLGCGGGTAAADLDNPRLSMPRWLPAEEGAVTLEVEFSPGDSAISAVVFALDIDTDQLTFDPTDADLDGIPDSVEVLDVAVSNRNVVYDAARTDAELSFLIADLIQNPRLLTEGLLVRVELQTLSATPEVLEGVTFADDPSASFGDVLGSSIPGNAGYGAGAIFRDGFESGDLSAWSANLP